MAPSAAPAPPAVPSPAAQSPPDLMNLYLQLAQRQRSANEIDRGLTMMAAANASPNMSRSLMASLGGQGNQGGMGNLDLNSLMQMQYAQRLMNMPAPGSDATASGLVPGGGAPAGVSGGGPQGSAIRIDPAVWNASPPDAKLKMLEQAGQAQIGEQSELVKQQQKDIQDAVLNRPKLTDSLGDLSSRIDTIKGAKNADGSSALQSILSSPWKKSAVIGMLHPEEHQGFMSGTEQQLEQWWAGLTPEEQAVATQMKQLSGQVYGEAFGSIGSASRRSTQEVAGIKSGLSQVGDLTQPYTTADGKSGYLPALNNLQERTKKAIANAYSAAGELDSIPDEFKWGSDGKPLADSQYLPGGRNYIGFGGQWTTKPPQQAQGGGQGQPVQISGPEDIAKLPRGTPFVIPSGPNQGKIGYAQ